MVPQNGKGRQRVVLRIRGRVQGVGYRVNVRRAAAELGVEADPVNLPDGSVRVSASGEAAALSAFREWCAKGPPMSRVESIEEEAAESDNG